MVSYYDGVKLLADAMVKAGIVGATVPGNRLVRRCRFGQQTARRTLLSADVERRQPEQLAVIEQDARCVPVPLRDRILDGRLRIEALRRLGLEKAKCIIATDDEAYTYNRYISRLTSAQDARMIARAIGHGVSRERIAQVLGIEVNTVKRRASLLDGISPEAVALLADKVCPATTFRALKLLKPLRQIAAVELMCGQGNFTSSFARAIVAATPPEQLEPGSDRKVGSEVAEQLAKLERELAMLQTAVTQTDERYGIEHLHLTVSAAYIAKLMENGHLRQWLNEHHPEYSTQFDSISSDAQSERSRPSTREPRSKNFRRVEAKTVGR